MFEIHIALTTDDERVARNALEVALQALDVEFSLQAPDGDAMAVYRAWIAPVIWKSGDAGEQNPA